MASNPRPVIGGPLASAVLAVRLVLELTALALIGWWVYDVSTGPIRWALALGAAAGVAGAWGAFVAPRARRRWRDPKRLLLELVVFGLAAGGLVHLTGSSAAWMLLALSAVVALLVRIVGETG